jgi:hypothetical protein
MPKREITEYERLTGFKPTKRERRFVVLLDYGYGPDKWVVHGTAETIERARKLKRDMSHWPTSKVRLLDQGER